MSLTINTKIVNDADNYSLDAKNVKGGYGVVAAVSDLANLPAATITDGSLYYVSGTDEFYQYDGTQWAVKQFGGIWGNITGTLANQTDLQAALNAKVDSVDGETGTVVLNDIKYTTQSLTDAQKLQARTNIGCVNYTVTIYGV